MKKKEAVINKVSGEIGRSPNYALYLCNPLANKDCKKSICFWTAWRRVHDGYADAVCFKTRHEEFAARNAEGKPIAWPEGEKDLSGE